MATLTRAVSHKESQPVPSYVSARYVYAWVTWLIHTCDVTHAYVWHTSFMCVTRLVHTHIARCCAMWLVRMCDGTRSYVWRDSFVCVMWLIQLTSCTQSCTWVMSFLYISCVSHTLECNTSIDISHTIMYMSYESCLSCILVVCHTHLSATSHTAIHMKPYM